MRASWVRSLWWILTNGQLWFFCVPAWFLVIGGVIIGLFENFMSICFLDFSNLGRSWEFAGWAVMHPIWPLGIGGVIIHTIFNVFFFTASEIGYPDERKGRTDTLPVDEELRKAALTEAYQALPQYHDDPCEMLHYHAYLVEHYPIVAAWYDRIQAEKGLPSVSVQLQALREGRLEELEREHLSAHPEHAEHWTGSGSPPLSPRKARRKVPILVGTVLAFALAFSISAWVRPDWWNDKSGQSVKENGGQLPIGPATPVPEGSLPQIVRRPAQPARKLDEAEWKVAIPPPDRGALLQEQSAPAGQVASAQNLVGRPDNATKALKPGFPQTFQKPMSLGPNSRVRLSADATLFLKEQPYRSGREGETFTVLKCEPASKRAYLLGADGNGAPIALNVSQEVLEVLGLDAARFVTEVTALRERRDYRAADDLIRSALPTTRDPSPLRELQTAMVRVAAAELALAEADRVERNIAERLHRAQADAQPAYRKQTLSKSEVARVTSALEAAGKLPEEEARAMRTLTEASTELAAAESAWRTAIDRIEQAANRTDAEPGGRP